MEDVLSVPAGQRREPRRPDASRQVRFPPPPLSCARVRVGQATSRPPYRSPRVAAFVCPARSATLTPELGGHQRLHPGGGPALYRMAITQIRANTEGRAYYDRKRAEGKTSREALRCLKRRLSEQVYKAMRTDAAAAWALDPQTRRTGDGGLTGSKAPRRGAMPAPEFMGTEMAVTARSGCSPMGPSTSVWSPHGTNRHGLPVAVVRAA